LKQHRLPPAWNPFAEVRWTIVCEAAPEQCARLLDEQIAPWFPWWKMGDRRLRGRASETGFRLYARGYQRHRYRLEAVGRFEPSGAGTRIRVRFRQERRMVLLSIVLSLALVWLIAANASTLRWPALPPWEWAVLVVLVPVVMWLGQRAEWRVIYDDDRSLRRSLLTVLSAEEDLSENSPS
jgi:hypothetical protein